MKNVRTFATVSLLFACAFFASCFGVKSDIAIQKNGSGSIELEYLISEDFLKIGTLDGNASLPTIPVGEKDFAEAVAAIDDLSLSSYSEKRVKRGNAADNAGYDILYKVTIKYKTLDALCKFMDTQKQLFTIEEKDGKHILSITFPKNQQTDDALLKEIFAPYNFVLNMSFPSKCEANPLPIGTTKIKDHSLSISIPMSDLLLLKDNLTMSITW